MSLSVDQSRLLATDRWRWLPEVLERWYAEPLTAADGASRDKIDAATAAIRCWPADSSPWQGELPEVLVEWFLLVGNRLHWVQDRPALPRGEGLLWEVLHGDADGVVVWTEDQGCWSLLVGPDGRCFVDDADSYEFPSVPLPTALRTMVLSDTLVGVWSAVCWEVQPAERLGPLGRIAAGVRGGFIERAAEPHDPLTAPGCVAVELLSAAYPEMALPEFPLSLFRGDSQTVLRGLEDGSPAFEWMTATDAAFAQLKESIDLDPPGGEHEVALVFEGLDPKAVKKLPRMKFFAAAVAGLGHLGRAAYPSDGARFDVTTTTPDEVVAALRGAIPAQLVSHAIIAVRPSGIASYQVVPTAEA